MNAQRTKQEIEERGLPFLLGDAENFSFQRQLINAATLLSTIISFMGVIASYVIDLQVTPLIFSPYFFLLEWAYCGPGFLTLS